MSPILGTASLFLLAFRGGPREVRRSVRLFVSGWCGLADAR